jgi:hypothetical protein
MCATAKVRLEWAMLHTEVTFIVTVAPVKDPLLLSLLVLSLNLQTCRRFNVVFYNHTLADETSRLNELAVKPAFDHEVVSVDRESFFGRYPLWDLYAVHQTLLDRHRLNEYFISLHMEEFLDPDYLEHLLPVLETRRFDILFGNLTGSRLSQDTWRALLGAGHLTYYYQLLDEEFTAGLLAHPANDPVLEAHRTAIGRLRRGEFTLQQALDYTRQNAEGTGTQNLNYRLHMRGMAEADTP